MRPWLFSFSYPRKKNILRILGRRFFSRALRARGGATLYILYTIYTTTSNRYLSLQNSAVRASGQFP